MEHFAIWLITSLMVTWGMYFTVFRSIKKFQNEAKHKGLKFMILLVLSWVAVGLFILTDNPLIQNIIMALGLVVILLLYSLFFVFTGNREDDDE
jgi:hypothetical protein